MTSPTLRIVSYQETRRQMLMITVSRFAKPPKEIDEDIGNQDCSICSDLLKDRPITHCGCDYGVHHWMHLGCLATWLHSNPSCPICKKTVDLVTSGSACFICNAANYEYVDKLCRTKCCNTVYHMSCYFNKNTNDGTFTCIRCGTVSGTFHNFRPADKDFNWNACTIEYNIGPHELEMEVD